MTPVPAIDLLGHGYIATAIADRFRRVGQSFSHQPHDDYRLSGDIVINAAGYNGVPNVEGCETHRFLTAEGNVAWPLEVERKARQRPVIHISTGCLYQGDGADGDGWTEDDPPNFTGSYFAMCKAVAQRALEECCTGRDAKSFVLRVRMPFGSRPHPRNLVTKLAGYHVLNDVVNSISCIDDIAEAVWHIVNPDTRPKPGIYNCVLRGVVSTREICSVFGIVPPGGWSEDGQAGVVLAPRSVCRLSTEKAEAAGFEVREVGEALRMAAAKYRA